MLFEVKKQKNNILKYEFDNPKDVSSLLFVSGDYGYGGFGEDQDTDYYSTYENYSSARGSRAGEKVLICNGQLGSRKLESMLGPSQAMWGVLCSS